MMTRAETGVAQTRQISGIGPCEGDTSLVSDEAPSDFSRLARKPETLQDKIMANGTPRRTLGSMSIAKLTSGFADGGYGSR